MLYKPDGDWDRGSGLDPWLVWGGKMLVAVAQHATWQNLLWQNHWLPVWVTVLLLSSEDKEQRDLVQWLGNFK